MNNILVPTDFSENAGFAVDTAIEIAKNTNAEVVFLHGFETWVDWANLSTGKEKMYPEINAQIQKVDQSLDALVGHAKAAGIKAKKSLVFTQNSRSFAKQIAAGDYGFIVLGSHGIDGFKKYTLGSNTSKILRASKSPVLVVQKALPKPLNFKTIVFASGLEPDTHDAFERLINFAKTMGAENVHLIEVTTPNNFQPTHKIREAMRVFVAQHHFPKLELHNINHFSIEAGILDFIQEKNADLIGIANHGRTDLGSLFIESIPENLVKYSDLPVLSIRV